MAGAANSSKSSSKRPEPVDVSMVALLAVPEKYDGKYVRTTAFLCLEFEGNALYLHEEDYRYGMSKNALWIDLSKSQEQQFKNLSLGHVLVEGVMVANRMDLFSGMITHVSRLESWPIYGHR
jgi:hypothetical protein